MNTQGSGAPSVRQRLSGAGRAVFGDVDWQPPAWVQSLRARVRAHPRRWLGGTVLAVLLLWLGTWWAMRPTPVDPDAVAATLTAPVATDYTKTPPELSPLTLRFDDPVAPLAAIGKAPAGVRLSPEHPGTWLWSDDRTLVFTPAKDWPIGIEFTITIDPARALAPKIRIAQDEHEFTTAGFGIAVASTEFYQDPETVSLKKAVYALTLSHPVDAVSLERGLTFDYRDGAGAALAAPARTVTYDEHRMTAWVHSAPLDLPENGGKLVCRASGDLPNAHCPQRAWTWFIPGNRRSGSARCIAQWRSKMRPVKRRAARSIPRGCGCRCSSSGPRT